MAGRNRDVFVNCPFDSDYLIFFHAIVFVVIRSGFRARSALETDDASENRFDKICKIIQQCRYGISRHFSNRIGLALAVATL
jgi:hypothetical protein